MTDREQTFASWGKAFNLVALAALTTSLTMGAISGTNETDVVLWALTAFMLTIRAAMRYRA